jgi:hypothetical protein
VIRVDDQPGAVRSTRVLNPTRVFETAIATANDRERFTVASDRRPVDRSLPVRNVDSINHGQPLRRR